MMSKHMKYALLMFLVGANVSCALHKQETWPYVHKSKWVKIHQMGFSFGNSKGNLKGVKMGVWIENVSGEKLWVKTSFQSPVNGCNYTRILMNNELGKIDCAQDTLLADVDYTIDVSVASDSLFAKLVDTAKIKNNFTNHMIENIRNIEVRMR